MHLVGRFHITRQAADVRISWKASKKSAEYWRRGGGGDKDDLESPQLPHPVILEKSMMYEAISSDFREVRIWIRVRGREGFAFNLHACARGEGDLVPCNEPKPGEWELRLMLCEEDQENRGWREMCVVMDSYLLAMEGLEFAFCLVRVRMTDRLVFDRPSGPGQDRFW
ncbi:hypothetical protein DL98DRAFT_80842 [Cadophora sp. DSE1049]|nr:hypothetical protein DL98DRAFT_80842 [Cadophora sp. DSE1049]